MNIATIDKENLGNNIFLNITDLKDPLHWLTHVNVSLKELPGKGKKKIAVVCPSFGADNLETLEEMEIRGKATFLEAGGETFTYIPCLNSDNSWITYLNKLVT